MKASFRSITLLIWLTFAGIAGICQPTSTQNYIRTFDVQMPGITIGGLDNSTDPTVAIQTVQYFDGLGRLLQTVQKGISPQKKDIITPKVYNEAGLDETNYLSYSDGDVSGGFRSDFTTELPDFYDGIFDDQNGKAPVYYERSPLHRMLKQGAPGDSWQLDAGDHYVSIFYLSNNTSDAKLTAKLWKVSGSTCVYSNNYTANQLYVTKTIDESGAESYEFKDKLGQVVLKRQVLDNGTTLASTYYVYDDFGLLRFVISPEGSRLITGDFDASSVLAKKYVYCYTYDSRKRLIEKQMPGKDVEYCVYNKNDKMVMYQDGNLRAGAKWMFTKYDALGRVIMTGTTTERGTLSRTAVQSAADAVNTCWEYVLGGTSYPAPGDMYYSNNAFPVYNSSTCTLLTLNYYDTYWVNVKTGSNVEKKKIAYDNNTSNLDYTVSSLPFTVESPRNEFTAGMPTVSFAECNGAMLPAVTYYDTRNRVLQTREKNHLNGYEYYTSNYSGLTSRVVQSYHQHIATPGTVTYSRTERTDNSYDAAGRLLSTDYNYNNGASLQHTYYTYWENGPIKTKRLVNGSLQTQIVDYTYNIRGWLTSINDPDDVGSVLGKDLFGMRLYYNDKVKDNNGNLIVDNTLAYNGNISAIYWQNTPELTTSTYSVNGPKVYGFEYDKLNRMKVGTYYEKTTNGWQNGKYTEKITSYDLNGNILKLVRWGLRAPTYSTNTIDDLTYHYYGNQVIAVDDLVSSVNGLDFNDNNHYYGTPIPEGSNYNDSDYSSMLISGASTPPSSAEYIYDGNGNLKRDVNKGLTDIQYNVLNLPVSVDKTDGKRLEYLYDATGTKKRQVYIREKGDAEGFTGEGTPPSTPSASPTTTDFAGNFVYVNNQPAWVNFADGRIAYNIDGSVFAENYITDHLGNVRVAYTVNTAGTALVTRQVDSYYPFGMNIRELTASLSGSDRQNEYLYNGKMFQDEMGLNWLDYGARFYDAVLGRWHSVDPLIEKYRRWSPFNYAMDNPMRFIDPDGKGVDNFSIDENGKLKLEKVTTDHYDVVYNKKAYDAGKRDFDESGEKSGIQISKGETSNRITQTSDIGDNGDRTTRTSFEVKTKEVADNLHKFLDKNTVIEYSNQNYTTPDGKSVNVITTSYETGELASLSGLNGLTKWYLDRGYTINSDDHNHPNNYSGGGEVSGSSVKGMEYGDKGYKKDIQGYKNSSGKYLAKDATFRMLWRGKFVPY